VHRSSELYPSVNIMAIPPKWYQVCILSPFFVRQWLNSIQFLVGLFASLGSLLFGYDLGVIAQVIASQSFNTKFKPTDDEMCVAQS
jgi:hypothetical protein